MSTQEALDLLAKAKADEKPSKVNPTMTRAQAVKIMRDAVQGGILDNPRAMPSKVRLIEQNVRRVAADRSA